MTKTQKSKLKENLNHQSTLRTAHMRVSITAHNTAQNTVLIIFPLILRTIIIAQILSTR